MTHDLSSLDSTIALLNSTEDITDEHAKTAAEAMDALPPEAFRDAAQRLVAHDALHTDAGRAFRDRVNKLNILMSKQPAWTSACARHAKWKEDQPK